MNDDRCDLSPLDPTNDPDKFERMIAQISWRARNELARRAKQRDVTAVEVMAGWFRPAMVAAAAIAAVSLTLLATVGSANDDVPTGAYMSSTEVPAAMTGWYEDDRLPTAAELLVVANQGDN